MNAIKIVAAAVAIVALVGCDSFHKPKKPEPKPAETPTQGEQVRPADKVVPITKPPEAPPSVGEGPSANQPQPVYPKYDENVKYPRKPKPAEKNPNPYYHQY